jgi:hypothetical protein
VSRHFRPKRLVKTVDEKNTQKAKVLVKHLGRKVKIKKAVCSRQKNLTQNGQAD